jgi:hypothetical protein
VLLVQARAAGDDDGGEGRGPGVRWKENGNTLVLVLQFLGSVDTQTLRCNGFCNFAG